MTFLFPRSEIGGNALRGRGQAANARRRAPLALCLALLALIAQMFAAPAHQMSRAADPTEIARELQAVFGAAASLCVQADSDSGVPAPHDPRHHCDDCPLCRASSGAQALLAPATAPPPVRLYLRPEPIGPPPALVLRRQPRAAFAQARAPPFKA